MARRVNRDSLGVSVGERLGSLTPANYHFVDEKNLNNLKVIQLDQIDRKLQLATHRRSQLTPVSDKTIRNLS